MTLAALIRKRESGKPANDNVAKVANDGLRKAESLARLAPLALANPPTPEVARGDDAEKIPESLAVEERRARVLSMLAEHPVIKYAVVVDNPDADPVMVALAIRDIGTCELAIPAANYDAFLLLAMIEQHGGALH